MSDNYDQLAYNLRKPLAPYFLSYASLLDLGRGTAFPTTGHDGAAVQTGARFFRTDLGFAFFYDGTRWLTVHEYSAHLTMTDNNAVTFAATTGSARMAMLHTAFAPYFTRLTAYIQTGATNNSTNYFTYNLIASPGPTTICTFNTSADAAGSNITKVTGTFTQPAVPITIVQLDMVTTGAPSAQTPRSPFLAYRLVVT